MATLNQFFYGISIALQPMNILYCFLGVLFGTLTGVLPGFGPVAAISILLPVTFHLSPASAIIMLAGIYYGAQYGGSTTSILLNIPGESSAVVTCLDGYQMAKRGRAGPALGIAAFGSFIAGIIAVSGLMLLAPPLAEAALKFGPSEYVSLIILGLSMVSLLTTGSTIKALFMAALGLFLGCVGMDPIKGELRFTYGLTVLWDGISLVPLVMGLFGISEILINVEEGLQTQSVVKTEIKNLLPSVKDWMESKWAILRGTLIGFFLGCLPGGGAMLSSFITYTVEKRVSKNPEKFGQGAIEGVAAPEAANNAASQSAFVPLLTLGLPSNPVTAIMLGAIMIHGLTPGPLLVVQNPELFWGVIASMIFGNAMLVILNLPLIPLWVKILKIPYRYLFPSILLICIIGVYTCTNNISDAIMMLISGVFGYIFRKLGYELAPLVLAIVLGPMFEKALVQSLRISYGNFWIFFTRPISLCFMTATFLSFLIPLLFNLKKRFVKSGFSENL
jgi:putative tricarboxylic transport membrane protein